MADLNLKKTKWLLFLCVNCDPLPKHGTVTVEQGNNGSDTARRNTVKSWDEGHFIVPQLCYHLLLIFFFLKENNRIK